VHERRPGDERAPAVVDQALALVAHHERRVVEPHEHALRAVLEEPAAALVGLIVPRDELAQRRVADGLALDAPAAAPVEREPPVDGGHVRPLGDTAGDDLVHEATIVREEQREEAAQAWAASRTRTASAIICRSPG